MRLPASQLMADAPTVSPSGFVSKTIGMLRESGHYEAFVLLGSRVGIISFRDILGVSKIGETRNSSIIRYVPTLFIASTVGEAARIMTEYRIRALPVMERRKIVGQVTALSVIEAMQRDGFPKMKARNLMTAEPITLEHNDTVTKARSLMIRRKIDHLPVIKEKKLSGMLTSGQIVFNMLPAVTVERGAVGAEKQVRLDYPASRLAESNVVTSAINEGISEVISKIVGLRSTYSLVTTWDEVQGIITQRDLVKLVAREEKEVGMPTYIIGLPEDPFESETAKDKFQRVVKLLKRAFPEILEARSVIKAKGSGERRRYEVRVALRTPYKNYSYSDIGWDLPEIYDDICDRLKRLLAQRSSRRRQESIARHIRYRS